MRHRTRGFAFALVVGVAARSGTGWVEAQRQEPLKGEQLSGP